MREEEPEQARGASNAAIMAHQVAPKIHTYPVDRVEYAQHPGRDGKPDSLRVDYYSGLRRVASEWVCIFHGGFAGEKARGWWKTRDRFLELWPKDIQDAVRIAEKDQFLDPTAITVNETGRYPEIIRHQWTPYEPDRTEQRQGRLEEKTA